MRLMTRSHTVLLVAAVGLGYLGYHSAETGYQKRIDFRENRLKVFEKAKQNAILWPSNGDAVYFGAVPNNDTAKMVINLQNFTPQEKRRVFPMRND
jgi:hypothetical protein